MSNEGCLSLFDWGVGYAAAANQMLEYGVLISLLHWGLLSERHIVIL